MPVITPDIDALAYVINGVSQMTGITPEIVLVVTLDKDQLHSSLRTVRVDPKTREQTTSRVQNMLSETDIKREIQASRAEHRVENVLVVEDVPGESGNIRIMRYSVPGVSSSISCRYRPI